MAQVAIDAVPARTALVALPLVAASVVLSPLLRPHAVVPAVAALVSCGLVYGLNAVALRPRT